MRPLAFLLALAAVTGGAGAQTATEPAPWATPEAPPCEGLAAFRVADARGRVAYAGVERERAEHYATFDAVGLALAPEDARFVWVDYMEAGEIYGASLYIRPAALVGPTSEGSWEADALNLAGQLARAVAVCFEEDASEVAPSAYTDSEGVRTVSQWATEDTQVYVRVQTNDENDLQMTPEVVVGLEG